MYKGKPVELGYRRIAGMKDQVPSMLIVLGNGAGNGTGGVWDNRILGL